MVSFREGPLPSPTVIGDTVHYTMLMTLHLTGRASCDMMRPQELWLEGIQDAGQG